jgi:hypothetical protein
MDWHTILITPIGVVTEKLIYSNHRLCFWLIILLTAFFHSFTAALIAYVAAFFGWLASMRRQPTELVPYTGPFDVLMGRKYRANTLTPDMPANNNVSIATFGEQTVIAYRKAETHFASLSARLIVATSTDLETWTIVWEYTTGEDDLREVLLWELNGTLFMYFCRLEGEKFGFKSKGMSWTSTKDLKTWTQPTVAAERGLEITWDVKVHEGTAYKVGYIGNHYASNAELTVAVPPPSSQTLKFVQGLDI